LITGPAQEAER